jgi:hypothetical protein
VLTSSAGSSKTTEVPSNLPPELKRSSVRSPRRRRLPSANSSGLDGVKRTVAAVLRASTVTRTKLTSDRVSRIRAANDSWL